MLRALSRMVHVTNAARTPSRSQWACVMAWVLAACSQPTSAQKAHSTLTAVAQPSLAQPAQSTPAMAEATPPSGMLPDAALDGAPSGIEVHRGGRPTASHPAPASNAPRHARAPKSECSYENSNLCKPRVDIESVRTGDAPDRADVRRAVRINSGRLRLCYEIALRSDPWLALNWSASARCDSPNAPCAVKTLSHNPLPDLTTCLEQALSTTWSGVADMPEIVRVDVAFSMQKRTIFNGSGHGRL